MEMMGVHLICFSRDGGSAFGYKVAFPHLSQGLGIYIWTPSLCFAAGPHRT